MKKIIDNVAVFKKNPEFGLEDLISNLDYEGAFDINENNIAIVGYEASGKAYVLDASGKILGPCDRKYSYGDLLAESCTVGWAMENLSRVLSTRLDWNKPDDSSTFCTVRRFDQERKAEEKTWAILINERGSYRLKEDCLKQKEADNLAATKYKGQDVILTVSSEDLAEQIACLNNMAFGRTCSAQRNGCPCE